MPPALPKVFDLRKSSSPAIKSIWSFWVDIRMDLEHGWGVVNFGLNDLICLETGIGVSGKGFIPSNPEL